MPSMNDHFIENMIGQRISYDVQPYSRGTGVIAEMHPRIIKDRVWDGRKGRMNIEYEVYDIVVAVESGSHTGALTCGVPVPGTTRDEAGKKTTIIGVDYGQAHDAAVNGKTIIIARCG